MFFSLEEIKKLKSVEGKVLKNVFFHKWQNNIKADYLIEFLEYIQFDFTDNTNILLTSTEDSEGLKVENEDIESIKNKISFEFNGDILIKTVNVSEHYHWISSLGQVVKEVGIMSDDGSHFSNEAILINFGGLEFEILPAEEGIELRTFEDRENDEEFENI